jgi:hypothetical protein
MRGMHIRKALCGFAVYTICEEIFRQVGRAEGKRSGLVAARQFEWLRDSEDRKKETRHKRSFSFLRLCAHVHNLLKLVALFSSVLERLRV